MSDTAEPTPDELLDDAMWSIWLHGAWRSLTRHMTTPEKEAAWAAVKRSDARRKAQEPDQDLLDDATWCWWRDEYVSPDPSTLIPPWTGEGRRC
jgi:hypothetical protein